MRVAVWIVLLVLLFAIAFLTLDFSEQAMDHDTARVKTVQQWGRVAPPYVVDSAMFPPPARARTAPTRRTVHALSAEDNINGYPCGGIDLPPCSVMMRESRGDPNAYNPTGCSGHGCYGLWQFSGEWACHFGLSCDIAHWTPEEQTYAARTLWAHGAGHRHWGI